MRPGLLDLEKHVNHLPPVLILMLTKCAFFLLMKINAYSSNSSPVSPIIVFDQPLWLKAMKIIANGPADNLLRIVVLQLGDLHVEM